MNPAELWLIEQRHEHGRHVSTVVHPNGTLMCSSHLPLLAALTRAVLAEWVKT